jgi:hypothetical protein
MTIRYLVIATVALSSFVGISAQQVPTSAPTPVKTETADGGTVLTELGYNITVNKGSSLHRSFVTINDSDCPAELNGSGVTTKYANDRYSFVPAGFLFPSQPLTAFEVRFVLFDMFGARMKTLSDTSVADVKPSPIALVDSGTWFADENEVQSVLTVASFVANARTASGKVWHFNDKKITDELTRLNLKITAGALEPTAAKK